MKEQKKKKKKKNSEELLRVWSSLKEKITKKLQIQEIKKAKEWIWDSFNIYSLERAFGYSTVKNFIENYKKNREKIDKMNDFDRERWISEPKILEEFKTEFPFWANKMCYDNKQISFLNFLLSENLKSEQKREENQENLKEILLKGEKIRNYEEKEMKKLLEQYLKRVREKESSSFLKFEEPLEREEKKLKK